MIHRLREKTPLMLGGGLLLFVLDVLIMLFRAIGLGKAVSIYAALLAACAAGSALIHRYYRRRARGKVGPAVNTAEVSSDQLKEEREA